MIGHDEDPTSVRARVARDAMRARAVLPVHSPPTWLVGGAVRDAVMGLPPGPDIDLVVEGDATQVATAMGRALGGRVMVHNRFRTARIDLPHGRHIDLVSARRETYRAPGALPDVAPGSLSDDLARRDFTINALAFGLHGPRAGDLLDPFDGIADIAAGCIRLVRSGAFDEDPSRVVRALRYSARLGFRMDSDTAVEARSAAGAVDLAVPRVAEEVIRLLGEVSAPDALALGAAIGLGWPDPDPARDDRLVALMVALSRPAAPSPPVWAMRLGLGVRAEAITASCLPAWSKGVADEVRVGLALGPDLPSGERPSLIDAALRNRPVATQVGALVAGAEVVARWWTEWRDAVPHVTGTDLVASGVSPGPGIGRALARVRGAMLDGAVTGRDEELALALAAVREPG